MTITQNDYVQYILQRYGMLGCSSVQTPGYGPELTPGYGPELSEERPEDKLLETQGIKLYQAIVGCVPYLAHVTRFDICYRVNELPGARSTPAMTYMTAAKHLLRYLKGSPDLAITYRKGQFAVHGYTVGSFASNPNGRRSSTGYLFLCGVPMSFGSKTQTLTGQLPRPS